jgi:hypothetical protein
MSASGAASGVDLSNAPCFEAAPDERTPRLDVSYDFDRAQLGIQKHGVERKPHEEGVHGIAFFDKHARVMRQRITPDKAAHSLTGGMRDFGKTDFRKTFD